MIFSDEEILAGLNLNLPSIQSPNYVAGVSGWSIKKTGTAEFTQAVNSGFLKLSSPSWVVPANIGLTASQGLLLRSPLNISGTFDTPAQMQITPGSSIGHVPPNVDVQAVLTVSGIRVPALGWFSVKDFGAQGDGVADDTAAIQAAIDANAGPVYFPVGVYLTGTLTVKTGTVLMGANRSLYTHPVPASQSSTLKLKDGTNASLLVGSDGISVVQIHDLAFDGNKANNTSGDIIHLDSASPQGTSWHIVDCYLDNSPHDGISIGFGRQAIKISRTWIMRSANNGITLNGADAGLNTVLIGESGANGVYIGGWVEHLTDCDIWSSGFNGVVCDGVNQVSIVSCGIDRNNQAGLVVQNGSSVSVTGCMFHSNSQQTNNTYPHISITSGAASVISTQFGYDSLTNNPDWAIKPVGSSVVQEWGNRVLTNSTVQGFISDTTKAIYTLPFGSQLNIGDSGSSAAVAVRRNLSTDAILSGRANADTATRFFVDAAGMHSWSDGTNSVDATMGRGAANRIDVLTADLRIGTAGRGLRIAEGANAKSGRVTLASGSAVVANTSVASGSEIQLTSQVDGGTPGWLRVSARTAGTSFTITSSSAADTSTVAWLIIEP